MRSLEQIWMIHDIISVDAISCYGGGYFHASHPGLPAIPGPGGALYYTVCMYS